MLRFYYYSVCYTGGCSSDSESGSTEPDSTKYTVTFVDSDGNTIKTENVYDYGDGAFAYLENNYIHKTGYKTTGFQDSDGNSIDFGGWTYKKYPITSDTTITVLCEPISYTIKFSGDYNYTTYISENLPESISAKYDEEITIPSTEYSYSSSSAAYIFKGWAYKEYSFSKDETVYAPGSTVKNLSATDGATVTLYPKFSTGEYTIKFTNYGNSSYITPSKNVYANSGDKISESDLPDTTKTGYNFDGWYLSTDESKTIVDFSTYTVSGDATFYASYTEKTYTITFKSDYGTAPETVTKKYSDSVSLRHSYTSSYSGTSYYGDYAITDGGDGKNHIGWQDENGEQITYLSRHEGDITLTAMWEPWKTTVKFDAGYRSGTMADQIFNYGEAQALSKNTFYRSGYKFSGWKNNKTNETYEDEQTVTLNSSYSSGVTIYFSAIWQLLSVGLQATVKPLSSSDDVSVEYVSSKSCLKASFESAETFSWSVDGNEIADEKTANLSIYRISEGTHTVMVTTESDGKIYSATLFVNVTKTE